MQGLPSSEDSHGNGFAIARNFTSAPDLYLQQSIASSQLALGGSTTLTLSLTNQGAGVSATGVEVMLAVPSGLTVTNSSTAAGSYTAGVWDVGSIAGGQTVTLTLQITSADRGVFYVASQVTAMNEADPDSQPNDSDPSQDDYTLSCVSVPIYICSGSGETYTASIPTGYTNIQWYVDGTPITNANSNTLIISAPGSYTFSASNATCPVNGCCAVIVEENPSCCPTIEDPQGELTVCSGQTISDLTVQTTASTIRWVFFPLPAPVDPYTATNGTILADVNTVAGVNTLSGASLPVNNGPADVQYAICALLNPTPSDPLCRPMGEYFATVQPTPVVAAITPTCDNNATACNATDDVYYFTVNPTGGTNTTYSISGDVSANSTAYGTATTFGPFAIADGGKTFTVTDANGCSTTASVTPPTSCSPEQLTVDVTDSQNSFCGQNNGSINITPSGGDGSYTYLWSNGATTQNIAGLAANTYQVTVTSAGCSATTSASISNLPAPTLSVVSQQNATCGNDNGGADISVSGGTLPYTYLWSNGQTTEDLVDVGAGTYGITVTDANQCEAVSSVNIGSTQSLAASTNVTHTTCGGNNGVIDVVITSGMATFTYAWSNGATTQDISGLTSGGYTVTIVDANSCTTTLSATIDASSQLLASLTPTDETCGNANGAIDLTASQGTGLYTYLWNNGATTEDLTGLVTGAYSVMVTDALGCAATVATNINNVGGPSLSADATDATCGSSNGTIALTVSGGTMPYSYLWSNGATTEDLSGLSAGTYDVTVTDANGCSSVSSGTINNVGGPSLSADATDATCGSSNGTIALTVSGGTMPYSYLWSNGATTEDLSGLSAGTYDVTVTDANGCSSVSSGTINNVGGPSLSADATDATCGSSNGTIALTVSGGTMPYSYLWSNGATTEDLSGLSAGTYDVTVTDANGCSSVSSGTINNVGGPSLSADATDATCGSSNGTIALTVSGGTMPYSYLWSNGATTEDLSGLSAGSYDVTVTDANGCSSVSSATINNVGGPSLSADATDATCGSSNGTIALTVSGGTMPYSYLWSNGATTEDLSGLSAGTYDITVTDANGCSSVSSGTINNVGGPSLSADATDATCGSSNGTIALTVSGGTMPYSYLWSNGATTEDLSGLSAGSYDVTVTDANGCSSVSSATINNVGGPSLSADATDATCGSSNGTIALTVSGGTMPYSYLWSNGATTEDLSGLSAGTYDITVTDANGCSSVSSGTINNVGGPSLSADATDATCGSSNGTIALTVSGGTMPYSYLWSNGATTEDLSGLSAGSYDVTVTDANGCSSVSSATINNVGGPSLSADATDATCGSSNGTIALTVSGGTMPYSYLWSNGATTEDLSGLSAGSYDVTVTDANGCSSVSSGTINNVGGPSLSADATDATCGSSNGTIALTVSGGTMPYSYLWSNGATTEDLSGLSAGSYDVTVTDANGCSSVSSGTINNVGGPSLSADATDATCGSSNGTIALTVSGGTMPYSYLWSNGATTEDLSGLSAGAYDVTVTDANGCSSVSSATINNVGGPSLSADATDATCGSSNGTIALTVSGGTMPYSYLWSNGATTEDLSGLSAGAYDVTVTDANGCSSVSSATINNVGGPSLSADATDATCGSSNGTIALTVSGGTMPYSYLWSNGATTEDLSGLSAGTYDVTVTDANGCSSVSSATINNVGGPSLSADATDATCGSSNGTIALTVSGGTMPYSYLWSNGATTEDLSGLSAGTYDVTVTDANGCSSVSSATINNVGGPSLSADATDATCGSSNGTIALTVSGGTMPYSYLWSNGATTEDLSGLSAGTYDVTVTDANGCSSVSSGTINNVGGPSLSADATDATCGSSNGTIALTVSGGTMPYSYLWSNGATTEDLSGLSAGTYDVTVTDANGCSSVSSGTINNVGGPSLSADATDATCGSSNGTIALTVSGGTMPYSYLWSNGATTEDLSGLSAGAYDVTVTDANGCSSVSSATINNVGGPSLSADATDATCGSSNGTIALTVSGGTMPYSYLWSNGATTEDLSGLSAGTYDVTVTDANGCSSVSSGTINNVGGPSLSADATDATCGSSNGTIALTVSGGTMPYSYLWSNGATTEDLSGLSAGTYDVTVTDANGCSSVSSGTINNVGGPSLSADATDATCGSSNGTIALTVSGGTMPYSYLWSNGATTEDLSGLSAGTYDVTVTDANGCSSVSSGTINNVGGPSLSADATDATCGSSNGTIALTVSGGTMPYSYLWSNGATTEDLSGLSAGTYDVTVTDANGCSSVSSGTINNVGGPSLSADATDATCGSSNGTIALTVSGGTMPYSYLWSNGATTEDLSGLSAGTYDVTVTDANGCSASQSVVIECGATCPVLNGTVVYDAACGENNGSIEVLVSGGVTPYTFVWSPNISNTNSASGLSAGVYNVTVTSAATNCEPLVLAIELGETSGPAVVASVTQATCSDNNGAIDLTVSGGVSPYTYSWSNGATTQDLGSLVSGSYTVTVTDSRGCSTVKIVKVGRVSNLAIATNIVNPACNGGQDGTIQVNTLNGTAPFTYMWAPNVSTTSSATNLSAGVYNITVTDASGCTKTQTIVLSEGAQQLLANNFTITDPSCPGIQGAILGNIPGRSFNVYNMRGSLMGSVNNTSPLALSAGCYFLSSNLNGCAQYLDFCINGPEIWDIQISALPDTCSVAFDGSVRLTVNGATGPYSYLWSNGATTQNVDHLQAGIYMFTVTDANNCSIVRDVEIGQIACICPNIANDTTINLACGNTVAQYCLPLPLLQTATIYDIILDGSDYTQPLTGCAVDTVIFYTYALLIGQGNQGPYRLDSWVVDNATFSGVFQTMGQLTDSMNVWNPSGQWVWNPSTYTISGGDEENHTYGNIEMTHIATLVHATIQTNYTGVAFGTQINIPCGLAHELVVVNQLTGCRDTINVDVNCETCGNIDTLSLVVQVGEGTTLCPTLDGLQGAPVQYTAYFCDGSLNYGSVNGNTGGSQVVTTSCPVFTASMFASGTDDDRICVTATDAQGNTHTTVFIIQVVPVPNTIYDTLNVGSMTTLCATADNIGTPVSYTVINCDGVPSHGTINPAVGGTSTTCPVYTAGNITGINVDKICVVAVDANGNSDTTIFIISINSDIDPIIAHDTIYVDSTTAVFCMQDDDLPMGADNIQIVTTGVNNGTVQLVNSGDCFQYTGDFVGVDVVYVIGNDGNIYDTTIYYIHTLPHLTEETITLQVGETNSTLCLTGNELQNTASTVFVLCDGDLEHGTISGSAPCFTYSATSQGQDVLCIISTDSEGNTDTTRYTINVTPACPNIANDTTIQLACAQNEAEYCLPLPLLQTATIYDIILDGSDYTQPLEGCAVDTVIFYTYALLIGQGNQGPYRVDEWEVNGHIFSGQVQTMQDLTDSMNVWDPTGDWTWNPSTFTISGGDEDNNTYGNIEVTHIATLVHATIQTNYTGVAFGTIIHVEKGINEIVVVNSQTGCRDTITVTVLDNCNNPDTVYVGVLSGETSNQLCLTDVEIGSNYTVSIGGCDGQIIDNGNITVVNNNLCFTYTGGEPGKDVVCLTGTDPQGNTDQTVYVINVFDPISDTVHTNTTHQYCIDPALLQGVESVQIGCGENTNTVVDASLNNSCLVVNSNGVAGTEEFCVTLCYDTNNTNCVTIPVTIRVVPTPDVVTQTIQVNTVGTVCLDDSELPGNITSVTNICPDQADDVTFTINGNCIDFTGTQPGTGTACIVFCDDQGYCDTTTINVTLTPNAVVTDTVTVPTTDTIVHCFDNYFADGDVSIELTCQPSLPGTSVTIIDNCVQYVSGPQAGTDNICLTVCSIASDTCVSVNITVLVVPTPDTVVDTVREGEQDIVCLDISELPGTISSVTNLCSADAGTVNFDIQQNNGQICVEYTGTSVGDGRACIQVCDNLGNCDTTYINVTVIPACPNIANDTVITVACNTIGTVDYCLPIPLEQGLTTYDIVLDGSNYTLPLEECNIDSIILYSYAVVVGQGNQGPYRVMSWVVDGQTFGNGSVVVADMQELKNFLNTSDPSGNWIYTPNALSIRGGDDNKTYGNLVVRHIASGVTSTMNPNYTGIALGSLMELSVGNHTIVTVNSETGCRDTFDVNIVTDCGAQPDTIREIVVVGHTEDLCPTADDINSPVSITTTVCGSPLTLGTLSNAPTAADCDSYIAGLVPGLEQTICVTATDANGNSDVTVYVVTVIDTLVIDVPVDSTDTICLPQYIVDLNPTITLGCQDAADTSSTVTIVDGCIVVEGQTTGSDTVCVIVCLPNRTTCDTIPVIINVPSQPDTIREIVVVGHTEELCPTADDINSPVSITTTVCGSPLTLGTLSNAPTAADCDSYIAGLVPGLEQTICVTATDANGNTDVTVYIITVIDSVVIDIPVDSTDTICLPQYIVDLNPTITLGCQDAADTSSTVTIVDGCIVVEGQTSGSDTVCVIVCLPNRTTCDTIPVIINVTPNSIQPDTIREIVVVGHTEDLCPTADDINSPVSITTTVCGSPLTLGTLSNAPTAADCDSYIAGLVPGLEQTICVTATDANGNSDVTVYVITVIDTLVIDVPVDSTDTICLPQYIVDLNPTITLGCQDAADTSSTVTIVDGCIVVEGQTTGSDTVCVIVCLPNRTTCDTIPVIINVPSQPDTIREIVVVGHTEDLCPTADDINSPVSITTTVCGSPLTLGTLSNAPTAADCDSYIAGLVPGLEQTICVTATDANGNTDVTVYIITVIDSVVIDIPVDSTDTICLPQYIVDLNPTITLGCQDAADTSSTVTIVDGCIVVEGQTSGSDTVCVIVCLPNRTTCDTIPVIINVTPNSIQPDTIREILVVNTTDDLCPTADDINTPTSITTVICGNPLTLGTLNDNPDAASCDSYTAGAVPGNEQTVCVIATDANGNSDTTVYIITVIDSIIVTVPEGGQEGPICLPADVLAALDNVTIGCVDANDTNSTVTLDANNCINVTGVTEGTDELCLIICTATDCDTVPVLINVTPSGIQPDTIREILVVNTTDDLCPTADDINTPTSITTVICGNPLTLGTLNDNPDAAGCDSYTAGAVPGNEQTVCVIATDANGNSDTTVYIITVIDSIIVTVPEGGQEGPICLPQGIDTLLTSVTLACIDPADTNSTITLDANNCVNVTGVTEGTDELCLIICTATDCDTIPVLINVIPSGIQPDTIPVVVIVGEPGEPLCPTADDITSPYTVETYICDGNMSGNIDTIAGTPCDTVRGFVPGIHVETICVVATDTFGNSDTTVYIVTVLQPITDTLLVGQNDTICLSGELFNDFDQVTIGCDSDDNNVDIVLLDSCIVITGVLQGGDTTCLVFCNTASNVCYEVPIYTTVLPEGCDTIPTAVDDIDTTQQNTPIILAVLDNDQLTVACPVDVLAIVDQPEHGDVVINADSTITYTPFEGYCNDNVPDTLTYVVGNEAGTDTATVLVYVFCNDFTIYNGMSPNGDGINDYFWIDGIQNYPNNRMCIFNRWGNQVYLQDGYNNTTKAFDGTWDSKPLPDGTYFFVLQLDKDDSAAGTKTGYLQIHR
jgi:gliding motility-associated-like protein